MAWPYPNGVVPRPDNVDHPLRPDPDDIVSAVPTCKHCGSTNLRNNGSYTSKRWNETRQAVVCRACNGSAYLPLGVWLRRDEMTLPHGRSGPRKSRPTAVCDCGSERLRPRGWRAHGGGRQQAQCEDCGKRFVLDAGVVIPGARNVDHETHWQLPDAAEEAAALVKLFETGESDVAEIRELIAVTPGERRCLELLAARGMLANNNIAVMLRFRHDVLRKFDNLIDAELAAMPEPDPEKQEPENPEAESVPGSGELQTERAPWS